MNSTMKSTLILAAAFLSVGVNGGEVLDGDAVAKLLVGNTVEMDYSDVEHDYSQEFHEYYHKDGRILGMVRPAHQKGSYQHFVGHWKVMDGKFCTSVLKRDYACEQYERIDENSYKVIGKGGMFRNVTIHEGMHHTFD